MPNPIASASERSVSPPGGVWYAVGVGVGAAVDVGEAVGEGTTGWNGVGLGEGLTAGAGTDGGGGSEREPPVAQAVRQAAIQRTPSRRTPVSCRRRRSPGAGWNDDFVMTANISQA
jgi:hypothetical protein